MRREFHVRFYEGPGVQSPRATRRNVYVRSRRAGERVMARLSKQYAKLRLEINTEKSAVAPAFERQFLGISFWLDSSGKVRRKVAAKAMQALKAKVKELTRRNGGRSMCQVIEALASYLRGWHAYFRQAETPGIFDALDGWIRRRLRTLQLKQWKRGTTAYPALLARGVTPKTAGRIARNLRRWWHNSMLANVAFPNRYFDELGLPRLVQ